MTSADERSVVLFGKHFDENNRLRRGRFSVRWSRRAARFSKMSWPRARFGLAVERVDELFEKHLHKNDVWLRGAAPFLKNVLAKHRFLSSGRE